MYTIDELLQRTKQQRPAPLPAFRFVRNSVHHVAADAVELTEGAAFPISLAGGGAPFFEWSWRQRSELTPPDKPQPDQAKAYDQLLAGRPVRHSVAPLWENLQKL